MIVDARVLPSGTTLYSTSATDKSPVRARHTPTNRTTETTRQTQRCALALTRAKVGAPIITMNSHSSSSGLPQEPHARQSSVSSPPGAQANISPDQLQHYRASLNEYISQAREHAQALRASYTNEVYELWHHHISTSAAADEASIASGSLTAQQLEDLTRKWVRLMRESRDMLHHESSIAAARAAVEAKPLPE